ncbi:phosphopantetheine adenylyltransferase [Paenibacillus baekrokdamisoli]|uniref:Phosphopantetheine adenylyltransferase n=1 Tax=Paenibacillus baekrokdamisoli TaxID=1712516 RepID=A0A3G9JF01_9BACL|nr:pantetheine-phosphate adenylyltransferase [Paenibacillus baekrokdamisoli]MBB3071738.1 pantetheine-phosphate adenylyltransferase [Paenibacillus baekrokdamisoli]BBH21754.1 phosphopantetheine adenylyltransferase [Paenibacillus baekrokdamisoli]
MKAVYAGSFDPITLGHVSVIERAFKLFDIIHIVVANNRSKKHLFSLEQRSSLVSRSIPEQFAERIVISPFEGIVADYINDNGIGAVIRGIRNATDLEYELQLEQYIRNTTTAETVYLSPYTQHMQTNSSLVRMFFQSGKHELASHYMAADAYKLALLYELGQGQADKKELD